MSKNLPTLGGALACLFPRPRARGEAPAAPRVDSVNTFDAPGTVTPKPFRATARAGQLRLSLAPASVTVVEIQ
jgi:alpha-N-arabinofuranosidase